MSVARSLPLHDVRVVAIEQYGAGPFGTLHLVDAGAEVVKVENPSTGGDIGRYVPPFQSGEDSLFFQTFNRGKRSVVLDLSTDAGRSVLRDLVAVSDVVYSNLRGDVPARLGIRYDDLKHVNPRIVCVSLSGYGTTGERSALPAYDYLLQGMAGWMHLTGEPEGPPVRTGPSLVDYCGGLVAALAAIVGVHAARRDGRGMDCDLSLFDVALSMLTYPAAWWLNEGYEVGRSALSAHPSIVPFQNFATADGWIVVACPKEKFWSRLAKALGRPELADDVRFSTFVVRGEHAEALRVILGECFRTRTTAHWLARLADVGVPAAPVRSLSEALADPAVSVRDMVVDAARRHGGTVRLPATALRVGDAGPSTSAAPDRGADTRTVMTELLGYGDERIAACAAAGAFGPNGDPTPPCSG